jgi:hypothetical protein
MDERRISPAGDPIHHAGEAQSPIHACLDGWVFIGHVDESGEERETAYPCRRCSEAGRE